MYKFELTPQDEARLRALRDRAYAPTNTATFRIALRLACEHFGIEERRNDANESPQALRDPVTPVPS